MMPNRDEKILFVDDDFDVLRSYQRLLRKTFVIETALGGERALNLINNAGSYAVIVSDLSMPGMDGVQLFSRIRKNLPDTVRIMITGHANQRNMIKAINEGSIFRFLTKPCSPPDLSMALTAGLRQYRLVKAEKEMLEKTLHGSVDVLIDILSLVNPIAFGRAARIKRNARRMAKHLKLEDLWQYELAAMLSQLGCLSLSPEILKKFYNGQRLTDSEHQAFQQHPEVGQKLLENIPRLEPIARMIGAQQRPFMNLHSSGQTDQQDYITIGGQILKVALDFDDMLRRGMSPEGALEEMEKKMKQYDSRVLAALSITQLKESEKIVKSVFVVELTTSMTIDENVYAKNGVLLVARGQDVTDSVLTFLRSYSNGVGVVEPLRVILKANK